MRRLAPPRLSEPRAIALAAGIVIAAAAMFSPLDALGARFFAAHMAQHLLLIVGAAPLLALAGKDLPLPRSWRQPAAAWAAAAAFVLTIWFWHIPAAHDWALDDGLVHILEHLTVLATAVIFWRLVIVGARTIGSGMAAFIVSLVGLSGALLSALIMFAPATLCRSYAGNPIEDQVAAGLLMCIPASLVYVASTICALWQLIDDRPARRQPPTRG